MIYEPRTKAPNKDDPNWYSDRNVFHCKDKTGERPYKMPNCTTYVQGDWLSRYDIDTLCRGNAGGWIDEAKKKGKYKISQTPKLGAIAVWKIPGTKNSGHVAIVEKIENNADIVTSNSAYKGTPWWLETFKAESNYAWTSSKTGKRYELQGFILPPCECREPEKDMTVVGMPILRLKAGKKGKGIIGMKEKWVFHYLGIYDIIDSEKWLYGYYNCYNSNGKPIRFGGWTEAKNLR